MEEKNNINKKLTQLEKSFEEKKQENTNLIEKLKTLQKEMQELKMSNEKN